MLKSHQGIIISHLQYVFDIMQKNVTFKLGGVIIME